LGPYSNGGLSVVTALVGMSFSEPTLCASASLVRRRSALKRARLRASTDTAMSRQCCESIARLRPFNTPSMPFTSDRGTATGCLL
jgi:hypothetical protein